MTTTFYGGIMLDNTLQAVGDRNVDLSERNYEIVMDALGIVTDACGHMDIDRFLAIAHAWLQANINKPTAQIDTRESIGNLGCRVIDLPLRAGYINQRVHAIVTMLARAKQEGATYAYWG